jgi:hypothetical protein
MSQKLNVNGNEINVVEIDGEKYISLTDLSKKFGESNIIIASWMRRKDTVEFLGIWEKLNNKKFKPHEFVGFKKEAGTNRFNLSPKNWIEKTKSIGIVSKSGRYGGTYACDDIALYFAQWLSPEFSLYLVKEFKRLKQVEAQKLSKDWQLNRALAKINYRIHTDAVNLHLIPSKLPNNLKYSWFAREADLLNFAIFGKTAKKWREENPKLEGNIRDYATQEQLLVLSNLESFNSQLVKDNLTKEERLKKLNKIAIEQMKSLLGVSLI